MNSISGFCVISGVSNYFVDRNKYQNIGLQSTRNILSLHSCRLGDDHDDDGDDARERQYDMRNTKAKHKH